MGKGLLLPQHEIAKLITVGLNKINITLYSYHARYSVR